MSSDIYYKRDDEVELIRASCLMVCDTLAHVAQFIEPGVKDDVLDKEAESFILSLDAKPGFKGYRGFPATLCISINEEVVHGIPCGREIKSGDVVSIDCGVFKDGYFGDAAYSFAVGEMNEDTMELLRVTHTSLYLGIEQAVHGNRIGDIGHAVQSYTEGSHGYGVVRELVGHGIGRNLHESPEVPNFGKRGRGHLLKDGLVIAIEPMINLGKKTIRQLDDGWTIRTKDMSPSAHYEHTVVVRRQKADILSDHSPIIEAIKNNDNLTDISIKK